MMETRHGSQKMTVHITLYTDLFEAVEIPEISTVRAGQNML
jgi:hypothetical protein